jgi:HK97 family phage portal protein
MIARLLAKRATILDNAAISLTDDDAWETLFGGARSDAGIRVNAKTALGYSPVWQAVATISEDISCIPTFVYKRTADGGKERALKHPAYRLLRRKANPIHTAQLWKQIMVAQALIYGNGYSLINRDEFATPVELLILSPEATSAITKNGVTYYETKINGKTKRFWPEDIFHLRGVSIEDLAGLSLIDYAKNSLGRGMAADKYAGKFFSNNAMPAGVLTHPHRLTDQGLQHLRESIKDIHGGLDNQHRVAILEEGMTWTALGVDPDKSQLLGTINASVKDVARWFKLPPHKLGDDSKTSFNSVEQENLSYQQSTLTPWFIKLREESFDKLLTEREKRLETHTVEEQRLAILAADAETRASFYSQGLLNGWLNRDEVRDFENMNPLPDGEGAKFMVPLNMQIVGEEPPEDEPEDDPPAADEADEDDDRALALAELEVMTDAAVRASKRLVHYTERAAKEPDTFCTWLEGYAHDHHDTVAAMFRPAAKIARQRGVKVSAGELAERLFQAWSAEIDQVTRKATADELVDQVTLAGQLYVSVGATEFARRQIEWNGEPLTALSS